jgi:hypothetical protein
MVFNKKSTNDCKSQTYSILPLCFFYVAVYFRSIGHGQVEEDTVIGQDPQIAFTMEALIAATENFHDNNKLGEGGFGPVYKVIMTKKASTSL